MKRFTAKDAKNGFGRLLDEARTEPVLVSKHGRPVAVIMAFEEYERLGEVEKSHWARLADAAERGGYLGASDTAALLEDRIRTGD